MSKDELARAKTNLKTQARKNIIERGLFQFRLEPEPYSKILDLAAERNVPVSAMVRGWVEERLAQELLASEVDADSVLLAIEMSAKALRDSLPNK